MLSDQIIMSGKLKKNNQPFSVRRLKLQDVFELHNLHKVILSNLKSGQECFIHHKTVGDFTKMIKNPHQLVIGAFVNDQLIGYSSANFINNNNIDEVLPNFNLDYDAEKIVVLEQASVNPEYRGNNLASIMNAIRQKVAKQEYGCEYAVTMVDINNFYSYRNGLRNGMCITQATIDPDDGGHIVYLSKEMNKEPQLNQEKGLEELPYQDMNLDNVSKLIKNGYVAFGYNDESKKVLFAQTNDFKFHYKTAIKNNNVAGSKNIKSFGVR